MDAGCFGSNIMPMRSLDLFPTSKQLSVHRFSMCRKPYAQEINDHNIDILPIMYNALEKFLFMKSEKTSRILLNNEC